MALFAAAAVAESRAPRDSQVFPSPRCHRHFTRATFDTYAHRVYRQAHPESRYAAPARRWMTHMATCAYSASSFRWMRADRHRVYLALADYRLDRRLDAGCSNDSDATVKLCIRAAARKHHQSYAALLRVARCESGLDPYQRNSATASGVFQFLDSTWPTTPYGHHSVYSAKWNTLAAAWMWRHGRKGEWVCQ